MKPSAFVFVSLGSFVIAWLIANFAATSRTEVTVPQLNASTASTNLSVGVGLGDTSDYEATKNVPMTKQQMRDTLRTTLSYPSALHRIGAFASFLDSLTPFEFAALHVELRSMTPRVEQDTMALFFRRWAQVAPEAALASATKAEEFFPALLVWAERDPATAISRFEELASFHIFQLASVREEFLEYAMPKAGQFPPRDAMRRIRDVQGDRPATATIARAMARILADWAKAEPKAAWSEALALPNESRMRERALEAIVREHAPTDPDETLAWIKTVPDETKEGRLETVYVSTLLEAGKVRQAREYAIAMPEGAARQNAIAELADLLFRKDSESAKAFVAALPDADWRDPAIFLGFFEQWVNTEPDRATEVFLKRFPPDAPSGPAKDAAYDDMFDLFASEHPQKAGEFFLKLPERIGSKLLDRAIRSFCNADPARAASWAAGLPPGATRERLMGKVAENWTRFGATQVTEWLDDLPSGSDKSAAIEGFAKATMSTVPDDALAWLHAVPNESERIQRLVRVWETWADREAARRWVETSRDLTENERRALQQISK